MGGVTSLLHRCVLFIAVRPQFIPNCGWHVRLELWKVSIRLYFKPNRVCQLYS
jgi:hypothetical protein